MNIIRNIKDINIMRIFITFIITVIFANDTSLAQEKKIKKISKRLRLSNIRFSCTIIVELLRGRSEFQYCNKSEPRKETK